MFPKERRSNKYLLFVLGFVAGTIFAVLVALIVGVKIDGGSSLEIGSSIRSDSAGNFQGMDTIITKVIDGDTVLAAGGDAVRLLGIDADEKGYPCYRAAKRRLEELTLGKRAKLIRDKEDRDMYNRLLRYISVAGVNVNLELVREGYAVARFVGPNNLYKEAIEDAEAQAIKSKMGCKWSAPPQM